MACDHEPAHRGRLPGLRGPEPEAHLFVARLRKRRQGGGIVEANANRNTTEFFAGITVSEL